MSDKVKFRISSALKDIIGKELITDQFIAIFELVKNSFDAYANSVKIIFDDSKSDNGKIIIIDDGKGMDYDDLINKWLFVAYSAKRDGSEEHVITQDEKRDDYRQKIKNKRIFAGAKGVGRFSCDRLGSRLRLITRRDTPNSVIENLIVNWEDFEQDSKKEFVNIDVTHQILDKYEHLHTNGTVLEISNLRDKWDRESLKRLKRSLQKLINPNQENDVTNFSIEIKANDEKKNDLQEKEEIIVRAKDRALKEKRELKLHDISGEIDFNTINGKIKNTIFEMLGIKSIQIISSISEEGNILETTLKDRGQLIYKITEKAPFPLNNIKVHLFYLNRLAKFNFTRLMGIEPINYGSVFMYKNGFRIYPYGEVGEDVFGIDKRKQQGYNRRLGTRELFGRIEIIGENTFLKESTSRDGGLIKNDNYYALEDFFLGTIRKLEKYVIDTVEWGNLSIVEDELEKSLDPKEALNRMESVIHKLTNTKEILSIEYDNNLLNTLKEKQKISASAVIQDIRNYAAKNKDSTLLRNADKIEKEFKSALEGKTLAEQEAEENRAKLRQANEEMKRKTEQNLFLKSVSTLDFDNILSLHHQIGIYSNDIEGQLLYWNRQLNKGRTITREEIRSLLEGVGLLNKKILSVVKFATKANFSLQSEKIEADFIAFVRQYIENIYGIHTDNPLNITLNFESGKEFVFKFKPIEITIILDNLLSNSRKANARNINIEIKTEKNKLRLVFKDDGIGINKEISNVEAIFEKGYTTTAGSGLGLFHVRQILKEMNSNVFINAQFENGFELLLEVHR